VLEAAIDHEVAALQESVVLLTLAGVMTTRIALAVEDEVP